MYCFHLLGLFRESGDTATVFQKIPLEIEAERSLLHMYTDISKDARVVREGEEWFVLLPRLVTRSDVG
jgi:hypothetical protein